MAKSGATGTSLGGRVAVAPGKARAYQRRAKAEQRRFERKCGPVECYRILPDGTREELPPPPPRKPKGRRTKKSR